MLLIKTILFFIAMAFFLKGLDWTVQKVSALEFKLQTANDICIEYKTKWQLFTQPKVLDEKKKEIRCD